MREEMAIERLEKLANDLIDRAYQFRAEKVNYLKLAAEKFLELGLRCESLPANTSAFFTSVLDLEQIKEALDYYEKARQCYMQAGDHASAAAILNTDMRDLQSFLKNGYTQLEKDGLSITL